MLLPAPSPSSGFIPLKIETSKDPIPYAQYYHFDFHENRKKKLTKKSQRIILIGIFTTSEPGVYAFAFIILKNIKFYLF